MRNYKHFSYRPTTMAPSGMVTSPHYLATQAGMNILQNGGNAIEAAIAAAASISVVYPHMNGIGGDNFWLVYNAKKQELKGLNGSGRAGELATIDFYQKQKYETIPARGYLSANTVPGSVAGWDQAYQYSKSYLDGDIPWLELLQPAISYAKNGFPVTPSQAYWTKINAEKSDEFRNLQRFDEFQNIFLKENGLLYQAGELMMQHDLAVTLETIANEGSRAFYQGSIGKQIVDDLRLNGGLLTEEDFRKHSSDWVEPISVNYRGYTAYNLPPNTQGLASLSILNILNQFDLTCIEEGSPEYIHLIVEATKLAFCDRDQWLTDPDFSHIPVDELISEKRGKQLAAKINLAETLSMEKQLDPKGDTVWLGVVDQYGNAVSLIQSIYHDFGSGIIPKGTGVLLQNRGSFFSLNPNDINCLQPNKRTFHTLNPAMLFRGKSPYLVYGTMGGEGQPQTQAALVTRIIDYNYSIQAAIEAPRWLYGRTWGANSNRLKIESRISKEVRNELQKKGHSIEAVEEFTDIMGHAGVILIDDENNVKYGGADPRGDGIAIGH
ncbi:gamma-glutamyltransferase [Anaerobacillus alkalidiazotrophicus]|uniref:Glutathione hydrolase proenzyme n=1 Tax=Anaerobacillus alkalidiazotrophicus TaxID=472963 RepID=A0A1S2M4C2_9BACI|nr:gamma-glutamyltransferase [Anaerobacillus alkalidiazotrophicus]OIJ18082.1 gamma-glutamyltransferase [Anaerobacillus alkalidiazotrophicus]OIJ19561.1 gamma-glutamyltransferase [Anaerobacillus alkalidiazotrophicus]